MQHKKTEYFGMIENCINSYWDEYGCSPTQGEIARIMGIDTATISRYLMHMRKNGMISYSGHRNITTRQSGRDAAMIRVPVLGSVSCGIPKYAEENIEEYVKLPEVIFGRGDFFFLRAWGDSMINAGIDDGDLVLCRLQNTAEYNQIVVAIVGDEATLKRFRPENGRVILHPENSAYPDIIATDCQIQGVAVKIIKNL